MLTAMIYILIAPVVTGLLVLGLAIRETAGPLGESAQMMMIAVAIGVVVSVPISMFVAKKVRAAVGNNKAA